MTGIKPLSESSKIWVGQKGNNTIEDNSNFYEEDYSEIPQVDIVTESTLTEATIETGKTDYKIPKMSFYEGNGITQTIPTGQINIKEFWELIISDIYKAQVLAIRECKDGKQKNRLKDRLHNINSQGIFSQRKNDGIVQPSGYAPIDIDKFEGDIHELKKRLIQDEHIALLFISPGGRGLKAFITIPQEIEKYASYVEAFYNYLEEKYNIQEKYLDKKLDISRVSYVSHDPEAYLNLNAELFYREAKKPMPEPRAIRARPPVEIPSYVNWFLLDYCLNNRLPEGKRHEVIEKNLARLISAWGKEDQQEIIESYKQAQGQGSFNGWLKRDDLEVNPGEIYNFMKDYNIKRPIDSQVKTDKTDKTVNNNINKTYTPTKNTVKTVNLFNTSELEKEGGNPPDSLLKTVNETVKNGEKLLKNDFNSINSLTVGMEGGREKFYKLFEARIRKDLGIQRRSSIFLIEAFIKNPSMTRDEITEYLANKGVKTSTAYQIPTDLKKAKILIEDNGSYTLNPDTVNELLNEYTQDVSPEIRDNSDDDSFKEWLKTVLNDSGELEVDLLKMPENFKAMALNEPDNFFEELGEIKTKFANMPGPRKLLSHTIKAEYMLKLIEVKGTTFAMSERIPRIVEAVYECSQCQQRMTQNKKNLLEDPPKPIKCDKSDCKKEGPFRLIESESKFIDVRIATLRSDGDDSAKGMIVIFREEDALSIERGMPVKVQGILRRRKIKTKKGETSFYYLEAINFEELHKKEQIYNREEVEKYLESLKEKNTPFLEYFKEMAFPRIAGMDAVKESILLSLVSPHWKDRGHGREGFERDNLNLLLVSEYGQAKGMFQRYIKDLEDVGEISGGHCTQAGLISATINDPETGFYLTIPGTLPKSDGKHVIINELQNVPTELMANLREAFEDGITHIDKANSSERIISRVTCIAFANYTKGFIEKGQEESPRSQIKWIDPGFLSRFDILLFAYDDLSIDDPTREIFEAKRKEETQVETINEFKKVIAYMRDLNPVIPKNMESKIIEQTNSILQRFNNQQIAISRGRIIRTVQCIAMAYARVNNRKDVREGDILKATKLIAFSFECNTALNMSIKDDQDKAQQGLMKDVLKIIEDNTTSNGGITLEDLKANFEKEPESRIKKILKELEDKQKIEIPLKGQYKFLEV